MHELPGRRQVIHAGALLLNVKLPCDVEKSCDKTIVEAIGMLLSYRGEGYQQAVSHQIINQYFLEPFAMQLTYQIVQNFTVNPLSLVT